MKAMILLATLAVLSLPGPAEASGLDFDHALHVEDVELSCEDCHAGVAESESLAGRYLPGKTVCEGCHDVDDGDACGTCHVDPEEPAGHSPAPSPVDRFNHASHVEEMDCSSCHGGAPVFAARPAKSECRACHPTAPDLQDCALCHSAGAHNVPASHEGLWETWHGVEAGSDDATCQECHAQDDCQACHSGDNVRPRVHPVNFTYEHSLEAKVSQMECETCHVEPEFCTGCHAANLVLPSNHADAGWRNGEVHGPEALFGIEGCIACHDAGAAVPATCQGCHDGG